MSDAPKHGPPRWLDDRRNVDRLFYALCAACALVVLADLGYAKHGHFGFEGWFGFHAAFGFVAYVGLVTLAKGLRALIKRDEDYYQEAGGVPAGDGKAGGVPAGVSDHRSEFDG